MSVSLCVLRIEIDEDLPEMGDSTAEIGKFFSLIKVEQRVVTKNIEGTQNRNKSKRKCI